MKTAIIGGIIWGLVFTGLMVLWPWMTELGTPLPPNYRPAAVIPNAPSMPKVKAEPRPGLEQRLLTMINDFRRSKKLRELDLDDQLAGTARAHAMDMLERGFFGPDNPDGLSLRDLVARSDRRFIGLIWAMVTDVPPPELSGAKPSEQQLAQDIWKEWEGSEATRNGLLTTHMNHVGVGAANAGGQGRVCLMLSQPVARLSQGLPASLRRGTEIELSLAPDAGGAEVRFTSLWDMGRGLEVISPQPWPRMRLDLPPGRYRTMFYLAAKGKPGSEGHYGPDLMVAEP